MTIKQVVAIILILNFPLKAFFHYQYIREVGLVRASSLSDYLYMLPIVNGPSNRYKSITNGIVVFQLITILGLLLINRDLIFTLIKDWKNVP
ncbi:hypothetical protein SAMN05216167_1495 [Spirosoma endophyticum]|uniref:Uncharacterized protein n=1 Tax=Spirosoma endophyticum TaxID=662367 RepID=A0A1I2HXE8_9BACT|nr:hypothetical protein SAMN05216167_1495 [Spirosoma endophyticum]